MYIFDNIQRKKVLRLQRSQQWKHWNNTWNLSETNNKVNFIDNFEQISHTCVGVSFIHLNKKMLSRLGNKFNRKLGSDNTRKKREICSNWQWEHQNDMNGVVTMREVLAADVLQISLPIPPDVFGGFSVVFRRYKNKKSAWNGLRIWTIT